MRLFTLLLLFTLANSLLFSQTSFISTWKTDNGGTSNSSSIKIPINNNYSYNYDIDWNNDGIWDTLGVTGSITHDFGVAGNYTIAIRGEFPAIYFNNSGDRRKLLDVAQWGDIAWESMENAFYGCDKLRVSATDAPDLSNCTSLKAMFKSAKDFNDSINHWNVSTIKDLSQTFENTYDFNQDLNSWNVSNVTTLESTFEGATDFNGDITTWNVSNVKSMKYLFAYCDEFNRDIGSWNVSNVEDMTGVFYDCEFFNHDISRWDVRRVKTMLEMFLENEYFNQDISGWKVDSVTDMAYMFYDAWSFNQDIGNWNVENVTDMYAMFEDAKGFDQNIGNWNVEKVRDMRDMFNGAGLSTANYDSLLIGWNSQNLQPGLEFDGGKSTYCLGASARDIMTDPIYDNWQIKDKGLACESDFFISVWKTDNSGSSDISSITIPVNDSYSYNYDIDWEGDGIWDKFGARGSISHTYDSAGTYTVHIKGNFPTIYFNNSGDKNKLIDIQQWGSISWQSLKNAFYGCTNFNISATDAPDLSLCNNMYQTFKNAKAFNADINHWDVSKIDTMFSTFHDCIIFNQDLNDWDVDSVRTMHNMFEGAHKFNGNVTSWKTDSVRNMADMFMDCYDFNQDISGWNVSEVRIMYGMLLECQKFNWDIGDWDVGNATDMREMFFRAYSFNQNLRNWDVSNVTDMSHMFDDCPSFDQNLGDWDVSNVSDIRGMFKNTTLSTTNYDSTLLGWSRLSLKNGLEFDGGNSTYCLAASVRDTLTNPIYDNWEIKDGGLSCPEISDVIPLTQTACDPWTNTYTQELSITYTGISNHGSLYVNGESFPVTGSPQLVTLTGLPSDGLTVDIQIDWSENPEYSFTIEELFTSPENCDSPCGVLDVIAGDPYNCEPNSDTYQRDLSIQYEGTNLTGSLMVSINDQPSVAYPLDYESPQIITLTDLPSNGEYIDIEVHVSEENGCNWAAEAFFQNPQNCGDSPSSDCDITLIELGEQICDYEHELYTQELIVFYTDAPSTGTLLVKVNDSGEWVHFPIIESPQSLPLSDLVPDGKAVDIFVKFSDDIGCTLELPDFFTAPDNCEPPCAMLSIDVGTPSECDPITNTYSQELMLMYENEPSMGNLIVAGQTFPITGSPQMITLSNLIADGNPVDISAYFSQNSLCEITETELFVAPEACGYTLNGEILFVVRNANNMHAGDAMVKAQLENTGYSVLTIGQEEVQTSDANEKILVLISNTVFASVINTKFTNVSVPVVCYESLLYDDLGMTGSSNGGDYGQDGNEVTIDIDTHGHPLAGGFMYQSQVYNSNGDIIWGKPNEYALKIASTQGWAADQWAVFAYETGSTMVSGTAPARRASLFFKANQVRKLNENGWTLFDAIICWTIGCEADRLEAPMGLAPAIKAYPNPFKESFNIEWKLDPQELTIILSNTLGQEMIYRNIWFEERYELNTSSLPKGIYLLQLFGQEMKQEMKLIKE